MTAENFELKSNEEPFASVVLPIQSVNAGVFGALGYVISGDRVVVIRLVDASGSEMFLGVTKNPLSGNYRTVFKNLPLVWNEDPGVFGGISLPLYPPEEEYPLEEVKNSEVAIVDLINILKVFRDPNDHRTNDAYETLKKGTPWRGR